jgi:hypothetical protein
MLEGKPAAHVQLVREVEKAHSKGRETDTITTDSEGYFSMPPIYYSSLIGKVLPMQFSVGQKITATLEGQKYELWWGVKSQKSENSESDGNTLVVKCELNSELKSIRVSGGVFRTLCTWNVKEIKLETGF